MKTTSIYYERKRSIPSQSGRPTYENHTAGVEIHLDGQDTEAAAMNYAKGFVARALGDFGYEPRHAAPVRTGAGEHDVPRQTNPPPQIEQQSPPELPSAADLERFMERMYELGGVCRKTRVQVEWGIKLALALNSIRSLEQAPAEWLMRVRKAAEDGSFDFKTGEITPMEVTA
jgi:hypothetical protein